MLSREAGEALTLQVMGVLEVIQGSGAYVANAAEAILRDPVDLLAPLKRSIPQPQRHPEFVTGADGLRKRDRNLRGE
jgi:DNA-binding GntR family transcriptional regulator